MNAKRGIFCIFAAILLMSALFKPGCRIIVNDAPLSGVYAPELAVRCAEAAVRAADEITRNREAPPFQLIPVLCLRYTEADETELCGRLLRAYDGVVQVSTVSDDGTHAVKYTYAAEEY